MLTDAEIDRLSNEQIAYLFKFCEKHLVYFYEVQLELVDHLANAIEEEMKTNPRLNFEKALDLVYSRFGVMGFSTVVREKSHELDRRLRKEFWKTVKRQFQWPQILKGLAAGSVVYTAFSYQPVAGLAFIFTILIGGSLLNLISGLGFMRKVKKTGKRFLSSQYAAWGANFGFGGFYVLSQCMIHGLDFYPITGGLIAAAAVILLSASNEISKRVRDGMLKDFPDVFFSVSR